MRRAWVALRRSLRLLGRPFLPLKRFVPRALLPRAILIIVLPLVVTQSLAAYVFYSHVWTIITGRLVFALVTDLQGFVDAYDGSEAPELRARLIRDAQRKRILVVEMDGDLPYALDRPRDRSILDTRLREALSETGYDFVLDARPTPGRALIALASPTREDLHYRFSIDRKRLFSGTSYSFVLLLMFTALLSVLVSLAFLRNQVRPIRRLAKAATHYGKGEATVPLPLEGAREVRAATQAFIEMRDRISSAVSQRTTMLNGISHDLRTPLTRLRLALEFVEPAETRAALSQDLREMEAMLDAYLAFARGEQDTQSEPLPIAALLREASQAALWPQLEIKLGILPHALPLLRRNAMLRVFDNLISNAQRYARRLHISGRHERRSIRLWFDDDGPGIPAAQRSLALRPFQRLDDARTPYPERQGDSSSGTGLGLSIAQDLITAQGGSLMLDDSPLGGLRVVLTLPLEPER